MRVKIYRSYGVLAHECLPVFSYGIPATDYNDLIEVEIPYETWYDVADDLGVTINGEDFLLNKILTNNGHSPILSWVDKDFGYHSRTLKEIKEDGSEDSGEDTEEEVEKESSGNKE